MTCSICHNPISSNATICSDCISLMQKGAEKGDAIIQAQLARCYFEGDGVPQNYEQAFFWFKKAAAQGHLLSQKMLGMCYYEGIGIPKDKNEAIHWFEKFEKQNQKDAYVQLCIGDCYFCKDKEKAISWFKKSAENGLAESQYLLCLYYNSDMGKDPAKAMYWCEKSAEQGNAQAQAYLGISYISGRGVPQDEAKSLYWLEKAKDNEWAQYMLGRFYFYGDGVPEGEAKAIELFKKSAEQGNSYAQFFLAGCYSFGNGVKKDRAQAEYWYKKSFETRPQNKNGISFFEKVESQDLNSISLNLTGTWQERLMQRIWKSGKSEVEVYKKAEISKQHFSKIRSDKNYLPKKETVLTLAVALELDINSAEEFLAEAGYAFSKINETDMIVKDFIAKKEYDVEKINEALYKRNCPLIGNVKNGN